MNTQEKIEKYELVSQQIEAVLQNETNEITQMATISCILSQEISYFFWTGFYRVVAEGKLKVGPYQGTLGCLNIDFGKGVCGTVAQNERTEIVPDTHAFPGHIACDANSLSEIVVPVFNVEQKLIAVFDGDSTSLNSFDEIDQKYLEKILSIFAR